jgi:hypothetical protein
MTGQWITIFAGPFPKALALQATLEAQGIATFLADETTKVMDPFITGANPLAVELRVPEDARAEVEEFLASSAAAGRNALRNEPDTESGAEPGAEPGAAEDAAEQAARLARRIRWCLLFAGLGWAVGAWIGPSYLRAAGRLPAPPPDHRATVALWCTEIALLVALPFALASSLTAG